MSSPPKSRIESIDMLKGLVMVIMALDHTRDYFHFDAFFFRPNDPAQTTLFIFFTRFISHFCAPAFSFLAGLSAFMVGKRKTSAKLSLFLATRGLWLIFVELVIINFGWHFDLQYRLIVLQTIWSLGISMIFLAAVLHLPPKVILIFSSFVILGHNLLDNVHFEGNILWYILHDPHRIALDEIHNLSISYTLIPWVAVMSLGYAFGPLYENNFGAARRRKILLIVGSSALLLFSVLIGLNTYGDPVKWVVLDTPSKTLMSMLNVTKYPPSLLFLLITLGITFLILGTAENVNGKLIEMLRTFGRVPFFFYILHIYLIHLIALATAEFTGFGWQKMILPRSVNRIEALKGYGFSLWAVYLIWIGIVLMLYPFCKRFADYKQKHKEKRWLSYL